MTDAWLRRARLCGQRIQIGGDLTVQVVGPKAIDRDQDQRRGGGVLRIGRTDEGGRCGDQGGDQGGDKGRDK